MGRTAPHADAIRALRPRAERARRAFADAYRLRDLPPSTRADGAGLAAEVVADVARAWPGAGDTAADLLASLHAESDGVRALEEDLNHLRHEQHEALHDAAWADVVAEIREIARQREGVATDLARVRASLLGAASVREALAEALTGAASLDEPTARAFYEAACPSFESLLASLGLAGLTPAPAEPAADTPPALTWLLRLLAALDAALAELQPGLDALAAQTADLDGRLEQILG